MRSNGAAMDFVEWLRANGAEILPVTNSFEIARFLAHGKVNVVYEGRRGVSANGFALEAWEAFRREEPHMNMGFVQKPRTPLTKLKYALRQRDGDLCFYCCKTMFSANQKTDLDPTIEHLVARGKGGPDHQDNLVLAHEACNKLVANMPLISKIKIRENLIHERYRSQAAGS